MKVIQEPPAFNGMRLTCKKCTAVLECELDDFRRNQGSSSDPREGSWDYAQTTCPICSETLIVSQDKFPPHIYAKIQHYMSSSAYWDR